MMKNNARGFKRLLRYLALFCFFLTPFPIFYLAAHESSLIPQGIWMFILLMELCGFFGFGLRSLFESIRRMPSFLISILSIAGGICFVFGSFFFLYKKLSNPVYTVVLLVSLFVLYLFSLRVFRRPYDYILTRGWFLFASGLNILILLIAHFTAAGFSGEAMLIVFLVCVAVFAVILNQRGIDVVMDRRGHSASQLPPRIRYYNMIIVGVVLAVAILLIIFRTPIVEGAKSTFSAVGGALLRFLRWFGGLLMPEGSGEELPEESSSSDPGEDYTDIGESGNEMVSRIFFIILVSMIILFSIRPLFRKIRSVVGKIVLKIKLWIHRERIFGERRSEENEYYTDTEETIDRDGRVFEDLSPARALRAWKKEVKNFQKIPDSPEKLIQGYRLACRGLELHGNPIEPGDTQLDILRRARSRLRGDAFDAATWCYDALVFGGYDDDLRIPQMTESLLQIREMPVPKKPV